MEQTSTTELRIGDWRVCPKSGEISRDSMTSKVEVRTMRVLVCLAEHVGEVVSIEELLNQVWSDVIVTQDSVYQAITTLRRLLGDDAKRPKYIETIPRLGYRMVAQVSPWIDAAVAAETTPAHGSRRVNTRLVWAIGGLVTLALIAAFLVRGKVAGHPAPGVNNVIASPERSIAVLPFLDLTEGMKEEEFADGMTEELIDKLSKTPGVRVPPPTSSFFYKD